MLLGDMVNRPTTQEYADYTRTRSLYATSLAYAIKGNANDNYANQMLAVAGGAYCIVTPTSDGLYAQPEAGVVLPINEGDVEIIRSL